MSFMFPDKVEIYEPIINKATKKTTYSTPIESEAYVEDFDKILYNSLGNEVAPDLLVGLPADVVIKKGWGVKLLERHCVDVSSEEEIKIVKLLHISGGFFGSHVEVYLA